MIMELNEREILRILNEIHHIRSSKLSEWFNKAKKHLPLYVAEYLFRQKTGVVDNMLTVETEEGLLYDPVVLRQGVDMLMSVLECQSHGSDSSRGKVLYLNFADPQTRVGYLKPIIDQLDIFPSISKEFIADLEQMKNFTTDPEELEILENYQRNVQLRTKIQEQELQEKRARQKQ